MDIIDKRFYYLSLLGIQQWQRRTAAATTAWQCQGSLESAQWVFIWRHTSDHPLDWSTADLQLLRKIMQAIPDAAENALLLWLPASRPSTAAPLLPPSCCCVVFGEELLPYVLHTNKISTKPLSVLAD